MEEVLPFLVDDFGIPIGGAGPIDANNLAHYDSAAEAVLEVSSSTNPSSDALDFGDLPVTLWSERRAQENWWISPGLGQGYKDIYSNGFAYPLRTLLIGTNGRYALAFQAEDASAPQPPEKDKLKGKLNTFERAKLQDELFSEYAKRNTCFAFKWSTTQFERNALVSNSLFSIKNELFTHEDAKHKSEMFLSLAKMDLTMVRPVSDMGRHVSKAIHTLPIKYEGERGVQFAMRPGGIANVREMILADTTPTVPVAEAIAEITTAVAEMQLNVPSEASFPPLCGGKDIPVEAAPAPIGSVITLLLCKVPTKKATTWKPTEFTFTVEEKTMPVACFNDTHLFVLHQKPGEIGQVHVSAFEFDPADGSGHFLHAISNVNFIIKFPTEFGSIGLLNASLAKSGQLIVCFGQGVILYEMPITNKDAKKMYLIEHRMMTCATLEEEHLMFGNDNGECHIINLETNNLIAVEQTAAVEPLFSIHATKHGKIILHSVMNLSGPINPYQRENVSIELRRPVAVDTCGSLIFALTKYGFINVMNCNVRGVSRIFEPPKANFDSPALQHAYKGIKVYPTYFVATYQNGLIRRTELCDTKK